MAMTFEEAEALLTPAQQDALARCALEDAPLPSRKHSVYSASAFLCCVNTSSGMKFFAICSDRTSRHGHRGRFFRPCMPSRVQPGKHYGTIKKPPPADSLL